MLTIPIEELVRDKRVILVGNSVEMMSYEYGDFIDSFDIVIHHGASIARTPSMFKNLGSRTDIWVTGSFRMNTYKTIPREFYDGRYKDTMVLFNRVRTKLLDVDCQVRWENTLPDIPRIDMFHDIELIQMLDSLDYMSGFGDGYRGPVDGMRPSGGFMSILYFTKKVTTYKSFDIIGFDFFRKITETTREESAKPYSWHLPIRKDKGGHPHNAKLEFDYVSKLEKEKKITWNILSNLNKETIKYDKNWISGSIFDNWS
mgnify:CR=1 FL=1